MKILVKAISPEAWFRTIAVTKVGVLTCRGCFQTFGRFHAAKREPGAAANERGTQDEQVWNPVRWQPSEQTFWMGEHLLNSSVSHFVAVILDWLWPTGPHYCTHPGLPHSISSKVAAEMLGGLLTEIAPVLQVSKTATASNSCPACRLSVAYASPRVHRRTEGQPAGYLKPRWRFSMRVLMRLRVQNAPYPSRMLFREASRVLQRKITTS